MTKCECGREIKTDTADIVALLSLVIFCGCFGFSLYEMVPLYFSLSIQYTIIRTIVRVSGLMSALLFLLIIVANSIDTMKQREKEVLENA